MFDRINITAEDLNARAVRRTLLQFRRSPLFVDVLIALISEVQVLLNTIVDVIKYRGPRDAYGAQLDGIGDIVGQIRQLIGFDSIQWFAFDRSYQGFDSVPVWVINAPYAGDYIADDAFYRQLIEAKVSRNFVRYASVPEIQTVVKQAFGIDISFVRVDIMTVKLVVSDHASNNVTNLLESYIVNESAERVYFLPLAAGVKIASVERLSEHLESS